jgi:hypothetical protein
MFWFGLYHVDLMTGPTLTAMAKLFEYILKCANDDKPYATHLYIGDNRVASMWIYPGIDKNPIDRITELRDEINALKEELNKQKTVDVNDKLVEKIKTEGGLK